MKIVIEDIKTLLINVPADVHARLHSVLTFTKYEEQNGEEIEIPVEFLIKEKDHLWFYTGILQHVLNNLKGVQFSVEDRRVKYKPTELTYDVDMRILGDIEPRDYQTDIVRGILEKRRTLLHSPTRSGKTEIIISAYAHYHSCENVMTRAIIIAKDNTLINNLMLRFEKRGFHTGKLGDGRKDLGSPILFCVIDSLYNAIKRGDREIFEYLKETEFVAVDEAQNVGADTFYSSLEYVLQHAYPDVFFAVSGTPFVRQLAPETNYRDVMLMGLTGGQIIKLDNEYLVRNGYKARGNVIWFEMPKTKKRKQQPNYSVAYKQSIIGYAERNKIAINCVRYIVQHGLKCIVIVKQINHGMKILKELSGINAIFHSGTRGTYDAHGQVDVDDVVEEFNGDRFQVLIGTMVLATGADFPGTNFMIRLNGEGSDNDIMNIQLSSRALCACPFNNHGFIIDFIDQQHKYFEKHSVSRARSYNQENYNFHFGEDDFKGAVSNHSKLKLEYESAGQIQF